MNFYNNNDEKDGGAPVIPGAASPFRKKSAFGKAPLFSRAAGSVLDRFKNLSRKDMAFVGIGLSVLVMAPVAEYMMSKPAESTLLTGGFGDRRGGPSSLYEPGFGALSAGSSDGSGEVITPLSARDPASLILGSQPAAPVMPPAAAAPPTSSWRDAVKDAGREAFTAASKSAGAPTVIPKMQSAFRSLFGGGGSSGTTGTRGANGAIIADAKSASSKAAKRSMVGPVAMAGYKGVASNTPNSSSKGAFEKLRAQADKSAGNFSGGSAMNSLDKAAADAVQLGAGSGGSGGLGEGDATKKPSNSSTKPYEHNRSGETLAEMAAKQRMQKALEWEFFKKYEIPKQIINAVVGEVSKWLGGQVASALKGPSGPGAPAQYCFPYANGSSGACSSEPQYSLSICNKDTGINCDIKACCRVGAKTGGTTPGGNNPPAGGNNPPAGGDNPPAGGGHDNPGGGNAGSSNPAVAAVFADYDTVLTDMLKLVQEGVAETDAAKLLDKNVALTGGFTNLKANEVASKVKGAASKTQGAEVARYDRNVREAKMNFEAARTEYRMFRSKFDRVKAAAENGTLVAASQSSTEGGPSHSVVVGAEVKPYLDSSLALLEDYEKDEIVKAEQLIAFNEASLGIYKNQIGYVTASAERVNGIYTGEVLVKSNQLQSELQTIKAELAAGIPKPESVTRVKEIFKEISGMDSAVTVPSAGPTGDTAVAAVPPSDLRTAVASADTMLLAGPLKWRGLPSEIGNAMSGGKLNDADAVSAEKENWKSATPKDKGDIANLADLNNMAEHSLLAGSMRAGDEIPKDVSASLMDPLAAADLMKPVNAKAEEIRKKLSDTWKIDMDNPTGSGAGGENPGGTPGGTPGATGVTNAATARADAALTDGTQRMALNQPVLDGINSRANKCTSTECTSRLTDARTAMADMTTLQGQIQDLQRQAMQPGANVAELDAQIQQKQRELHAADTRFDEASKRVAALEGYTPPKPPAQPTTDQVAKQEDINAAELHVRAIDACYVGTSGFKPGGSGLCEQQLATRTATTVLTARAWRGDIAASNDDAYRNTLLGNLSNERGTAYGWASRCLRTMPAGCTR